MLAEAARGVRVVQLARSLVGLLAESSAIPILILVLVRARLAAIANASGIGIGDAVQGVGAAACVVEQNTAHDQRVMDSPPSLKIFPYHLCETSLGNKAPGRRSMRVKIGSVGLGLRPGLGDDDA